MNDTLKECPFCGGEAHLYVRDFTDEKASFGNAFVECTACGIEQLYHRTEAEAIAAWNARKSPRTEMGDEAGIEGIWEQARENHETYSATGDAESDLRFLTLGLVGEAGELANFVKKRWRDGTPLDHATGELHLDECRKEVADVLAYTMMVAQRLGMTPESLIATVAEKQAVFVAKMKALRTGEATDV